MSRYEANKLQNVVLKAAKAVFDNEKFPVSMLAVRAKKLAEIYPRDNTAVGMYRFLTKRASGSKQLFITRSELRDVYNKLYSNRNKFAQEFKNELGLTEDNKVTKMKRDPKEGFNLVDESYDKLTDPILSEKLSAALENRKSYNLYSKSVAKSAQKVCAYELNSHGALPKNIDVVAGQSDVLICQATYDTPKGKASVLIPVEVKGDRALFPSMFLSTSGFVPINQDALQEHVLSTAGKSYQVNVQELLQKISDAKNGTVKPTSEVEQMVMKVTASKETPATNDPNAILQQKVDPEYTDVKTPKLSEPKEFQGIGEYLSSSAGDAEFRFGKDTIELGRKLVANELSRCGFNKAQVVVSDSAENSIKYAVSIDGQFGFNVNAAIDGKKVHLPNILVSGGSVYAFTKSGLDNLLSSGQTDPVALAKTYPMYDEKPSDLVEIVRAAINDKNYVAAEEALHVLRNSENDAAYKTAYDIYVRGLSGQAREERSNCNAPVQTRASKHMICSHTGLPVHKVYQDKYGNCRPLYRKGMEDSTDSGASFMTSKVLFE